MQAEFWLQSWQEGGTKTSFHRPDLHPYLMTYAPAYFLCGQRVLVPLCGKDNALLWCRDHSLHVVGIELAETAILQFFAENNLPYRKTSPYRYEADNLTMLQADIFKLTPEEVGPIDFVYDRAALVALPEEMRQQYRQKIDEFLPIHGKCLLVTLEYEPYLGNTPPFSITPQEVEDYYGQTYAIHHVEQPELPEHRMVQKFNLNFLKEHGFILTKLKEQSDASQDFHTAYSIGWQRYRNVASVPSPVAV